MKKAHRPAKAIILAAPLTLPPAFQFLSFLVWVWACFVLSFFLLHYPISFSYVGNILGAMIDVGIFHPYMKQVVMGFAVGLFLLILAAHTGARLIQRLIPETHCTKHELLVLGAALGCGLGAFSVLGLGALSFWQTPIFAVGVLTLAVGVICIPLQAPPSVSWRATAGTDVWKWFLGAFALLYVIGAASPEIFYDSLHYHLAIPNLYRLQHQVTAVPTMLYADFVMSIQMLYGLALTLGNSLSPKVMHIGMAAFLGWGFVLSARRLFGSNSGWLAALLFFSIPMVTINAISAGTDVGGAFLFFASAMALVMALENKTIGAFRLAGVLTGIAASTKFPAFVFIPLAGVILVGHWVLDEKKPWREWLAPLANFVFFAVLFLTPILLKNSIFHGNPLYPFGGTSWGHPKINPADWTLFIADASARDLRTVFSSGSALWHFILEPWYVSLGSQGTVGPLLLMGLPLVIRRAPSLAYKTFQRYALLLWLTWLFTSTVPRYGLPAMVLLCALVAETLLTVSWSALLRWGFIGIFTSGMVINFALQLIIVFSYEGWQVVAGKLSEDAYLGRMHATYPTPPYDALIWMNQNLPQDAVVLFAGESRSYYLQRKSIPSSIPGPQPVVAWSKECRSGTELAAKVRAHGATHIFLNLMEALRTDSYREFVWDTASWNVFDDFWTHHVRMIWKQENQDRANPQALYVFELLPESVAAQPHPPFPNPFIHWKPAGTS